MPPANDRDPHFAELAARYGFSPDGVASMLTSVAAGNGRMAQFDHPDFGGAGQWMRGGMTMVADAFDSSLKARVSSLCSDLADSLRGAETAEPAAGETARDVTARWWPREFGSPNSAGAQNGIRYAYFATARRLAIEEDGDLTVYDTLDHQIDGVAQAQSTDSSLIFSSDRGRVDVSTLPIVSDGSAPASLEVRAPIEDGAQHAAGNSGQDGTPGIDPFMAIEKLAELRSNGILSNDEFAAKKAELLRRI